MKLFLKSDRPPLLEVAESHIAPKEEQEMKSIYPTSVLIEDAAETEFAPPPLIKQPDGTDGMAEWNLATLVAFRFVFAYLVLYDFPFLVGLVPGLDYLGKQYTALLYKIVPWVGSHILHLSNKITVFPNGSGDTTYNYVEVLCFLVVAGVATLVWSLLDRKRPNYVRLHLWLRLGVRFALGSNMLFYGAMKVIPFQMPAPSLSETPSTLRRFVSHGTAMDLHRRFRAL